MISKTILILLFLNQWAIAQIQGHPVENGPKVIINDQELHCNQMANNSSLIEKEFCIFWERKYESENDFLELIETIKINLFYETLDFLSRRSEQPLCMQLSGSGAEGTLTKRSNFKKEAALLKEMSIIWKGASDIEDCKSKFKNRALRLDDLELLLKLYEPSIN